MTPAEIKKKILQYKWERWLDRPFGAFVISLFCDGMKRKYMEKIGVKAEYSIFVFDHGSWYTSKSVTKPFERQVKKYIASGGSIFKISRSCEQFYKEKKKIILSLLFSKEDCIKKLEIFYEIMSQVIPYIWLAHGLDDIYLGILRKEAAKYIKADVEQFIGDISFPVKKNTHTLMEESVLKGIDLDAVAKEYGWIKVRDGFAAPFTKKELVQFKKKLLQEKNNNKPRRLIVPKQLRSLAKETQELVYFRTLRTDVFFEFLFLARPILKEVAKKYGLDFQDLRNYSIQDLIAGVPKKYPEMVTAVCYRGDFFVFDKPIMKQEKIISQEIRGAIAFAGVVRGKVVIVNNVKELGKVKTGDILVTYMTTPSFILAMKRAAAFVTNEGGLTCHAAIIAREMKKPCITGTKIATKVLKDGDIVEVDAEVGVVRKI